MRHLRTRISHDTTPTSECSIDASRSTSCRELLSITIAAAYEATQSTMASATISSPFVVRKRQPLSGAPSSETTGVILSIFALKWIFPFKLSASFSTSVPIPSRNDPSDGSASVTATVAELECPTLARRLPSELFCFCLERYARMAPLATLPSALPFNQIRKCALHTHFVRVSKKDCRNKWVHKKLIQDF